MAKGISYNVLVSESDFPFVSGAITIDKASPIITRKAAESIVGPIPNSSSIMGVPYVDIMVPIREIEIAIPTAEARTAVGNNSFG